MENAAPAITDEDLRRAFAAIVPAHRVIADPLRRLTYGTDASFYRLVPRLVVVVEREDEVVGLLALCRRLQVPVTFRPAGTSLSGQAVTDSVLVLIGDDWQRCEIGPGAETIRLQPGVIGGVANRKLTPFGRKIGPDPASIDAAMIGGIAANNASGMCCGTAQNSYRTLAAMRVVLADGAVLDTADPASVASFRTSHADLLATLGALAHETKGNAALAERIRHKFRIKNTTGCSLNALVDFDDPLDMLIHVMIGSEGTLGFISEITYRTVPEHPCKASALVVFDDLESACTAAEVSRYARFMDAVCELVVHEYDGSLKAEHGTGRNMAPFVELEWGRDAYALMRRIKVLLDPQNLLNPGVLLNADRQVHLKNLKPLPAADPLVDKCIECGFCEVMCPSRALTLSPRQRIAGWREIARLERLPDDGRAALPALRELYDYHGIDTWAGCGLCATACPVSIETGKLIKSLRGRRAGTIAVRAGDQVAERFGTVTQGVRAGLWWVDAIHGLIGTGAMRSLSGAARRITGGRTPLWRPAMPRAASFAIPRPARTAAARASSPVVYFPSCAARTMGPARGGPETDTVPVVTDRLLRKAGFDVVYPDAVDGYCCGQPLESKGLADPAERKAGELEAALMKASDGGRIPIVFDTSPCAYRMKQHLGGRLPVMDIVEFAHDVLQDRLAFTRWPRSIAVHPVCSLRKMGLDAKLATLARACAETVTIPDAVLCCGFAGDKGFTTPELNAHALRFLKDGLPAGCADGLSSSPTCEIGLTDHAGIPYRSIVYLLDACTTAAVPRGMAS